MLVVDQIYKKYSNGFVALEDINFQLDKKDILGLIGPNGAGKTTLLNILSNLLEPTKGSIKINDISKKSYTDGIGFVTEDVCLYEDMSGYDNLYFISELFQLDNIPEIIMTLVEEVELNKVIYEKVRKYSSGMKKRLSIARALLHNPSVILMDEPTNTLDVENREIVFRIIERLKLDNKIIIISSHNLDELKNLCNKFLFLNKRQKFLYEADELIYNITNIEIEIKLLNRMEDNKLKKVLPESYKYFNDSIIMIRVDNIKCIPDIIENLVTIGAKIIYVQLKNNALKELYLNGMESDGSIEII